MPTGEMTTTWLDIRAEMARTKVTIQEIADEIGWTYSRLAPLFAAENETMPTQEFADRMLVAIRGVAERRAA